jgi:hypothetical protein
MMIRRTWLDRLLLGRDVSAKAEEAEERLRRADRVRDILDADEALRMERLGSEVAATKSAAASVRVKSEPPRRFPSLPEIELETRGVR